MSHPAQDALQQALLLTIRMGEAAAADNWALVTELDEQRQLPLQQMHDASLDIRHRDALASLEAHNRAVLERAHQVREAVEQQLSQHQYNFRALQRYVSSSR